MFSGTNCIIDNSVLITGSGGHGIFFSFSNATIGGIFVLQNNIVRLMGGGIYGGYSSITFQQGVMSLIEANSAESGGALL